MHVIMKHRLSRTSTTVHGKIICFRQIPGIQQGFGLLRDIQKRAGFLRLFQNNPEYAFWKLLMSVPYSPGDGRGSQRSVHFPTIYLAWESHKIHSSSRSSIRRCVCKIRKLDSAGTSAYVACIGFDQRQPHRSLYSASVC